MSEQALNQKSILLTGLPGAGKSAVAQSLVEQFNCNLIDEPSYKRSMAGVYEHRYSETLLEINAQTEVWCVIDTRSTLEECNNWVKNYLSQLIRITDVVVLTFLENSSLETQAWWNRWLNQQIDKNKTPPITLRWFHKQFSDIEKALFQQKNVNKRQLPEHAIESFEYQIDKVMLEHLLMGLDNSRRTLGMNLLRVTAVLKTFEYENLIQLEGTPNRFDQYASLSDTALGKIVITGESLDKQWLEQLIQASKIS